MTRPRRALHMLGAILVIALGALLVAPIVAAADETEHDGRVLIATGGDLTVPAGEQADAVMVIGGEARIAGAVETLIVIDGRAILDGAQAETIIAVRSPVDLAGATTIGGDVMTFDSVVTQAATVQLGGTVRDLAPEIAGAGFVFASAMLLLYIGFGVATIAAGLLMAALAARQVREAETLIRREPVMVMAVAIVGLVVPIVVSIALMVTVVGAPLGLGILFGLWPLVAFLGYLVAGIAIGDWILGRISPHVVRERPYLAAVIGLIVLHIVGIVPLVSAIASLFGFGAVVLLAWRIATRRSERLGRAQPAHAIRPSARPGLKGGPS